MLPQAQENVRCTFSFVQWLLMRPRRRDATEFHQSYSHCKHEDV